MNAFLKITLSISLILFGFSEINAQWGNKKIVGNGNITTQTISTSDYSAINGIGSMDIHLEKGTEGTIRVKTDSNLQEYVEIEVSAGVLKIRTKKNINLKTKNGIHVYVPFMDISEVSLVGSGDIDTEDTVKSDAFSVKVTGSGDVNLSVSTNDLQAKITGSGDVVLKGDTKNLDVTISGSGDFNGNDLESESTSAQVSGSGDATVNASKYLNARVNGSGDIKYGGNPEKRDTKVSGSGRISSN
jgi:hypothetical protein